MKRLFFSLILLFSTSSFANCDSILIDKYVPKITGPSTFICKDFFAIIYDGSKKRPVVTIEKITAESVKNSTLPRKGSFRPDPFISADQQPDLKYLAGTAFDKGHLVPYEDMSFNVIAADNTMLLTNVVPQYSDHNRGIWKALEGRVRKLTINGDIFIFTGPIYFAVSLTFPDKTPIPASLFKIAINPITKESYCFIIPNMENIDTANLNKYTCKISDVMKKTPIVRLFPLSLKLTEKPGL